MPRSATKLIRSSRSRTWRTAELKLYARSRRTTGRYGLGLGLNTETAEVKYGKLPTVLICEQDEHLPFDIAQMRTIFFSHTDLRSSDRCRTEIVRHLRLALNGAVDSPVAASVDLQRLQAGDTVERNIAELITSVSDLQKALADIRLEVRQALRQEEPLARVRLRLGLAEADERLEEMTRRAQERQDTQTLRRL
jgi:hypothetical protein